MHIVRFHPITHHCIVLQSVKEHHSDKHLASNATHLMVEKLRNRKGSYSHNIPFRDMLCDQQMSHSALPL